MDERYLNGFTNNQRNFKLEWEEIEKENIDLGRLRRWIIYDDIARSHHPTAKAL